MRRISRASCLGFLLLCPCGGQPVGSRVPRPDPAAVALGAAAAATALTLANPNAPAPKPERDTARELREKPGPKETVPEAVLDRAESGAGRAAQPCRKAAPPPAANEAGATPALDLTPDPGASSSIPPPPPPERCADGDPDAGPPPAPAP